MSRTDVVASPRLQTADKAPMRKRSSRVSRRHLVLPVALLLAVALVAPTTAIAAEGLSGYNQTPKPSSGTSPSKEKATPTKEAAPKKETAPAKTTTAPTTESKAKTLPFTGFDLRWTIAGGLLLMGMGFSIVTVQRRQRRDTGS